MQEILSRRHYGRAFYMIFVLVLLVVLLLRGLAVPAFDETLRISWAEFAALLLDTLAASIVVTVVVGSFLFWLTPDIVRRSVIEVVEPGQINHLLKEATASTGFWIYKGACGRYTRATTLPKLAEGARTHSIGRDITICILNPRNQQLCEEYATYRRSLKSGENADWTKQRVQEEVIATVLSAMKFNYLEPLLRIRLFLVDSFSAFRLDISDRYVIVTKEDKRASALRADAGTYFYDSYKDDVRLTERQAHEVHFDATVSFSPTLSEEQVRNAMEVAKLVDVGGADGLNILRIMKCVNSPDDPY